MIGPLRHRERETILADMDERLRTFPGIRFVRSRPAIQMFHGIPGNAPIVIDQFGDQLDLLRQHRRYALGSRVDGIQHQQGQRCLSIWLEISEREVAQVFKEIQAALEGQPLPPSYRIEYGGTAVR